MYNVLCLYFPGFMTVFGGKGANQAVSAGRFCEPGKVAMISKL